MWNFVTLLPIVNNAASISVYTISCPMQASDWNVDPCHVCGNALHVYFTQPKKPTIGILYNNLHSTDWDCS